MKHLFKAKRVDNGEMVEGYYYHDQIFKNGNACQDVFYIRDEIDQDFEVLPETVVYLPNEELAKRWEVEQNKVSLINKTTKSFYDSLISGGESSRLKQCLTELKEAFQ